MKTISISDDLYRRLKDLSNEIKTQDNRATVNVFILTKTRTGAIEKI